MLRILRSIRRLATRRGPNAIIWWGSFERGGATIGDLHAVENLSSRLEAIGFEHVVVSKVPIAAGKKTVRDWRELSALRTIIFVCGPIVDFPPLLELLDAHRSARRVAVGVSVLANQTKANSYFDQILPRDGALGTTFDLALARYDREVAAPADHGVDAVCFRGMQTEYGADRPAAYQRAEELLLAGVRSARRPVVRIETVIDGASNSADDVAAAFARASIIATTRLHGGLYALAFGRVPVAIDQIPGGAKVSAILETIGWPLVYRAASANSATITAAFERARSPSMVPIVRRCRSEAIGRSVDALERAVKIIGNGR